MKEVWNTAIYVTIVFVHVSCFIYFYEIYYLGSNKYVLLNNCGVPKIYFFWEEITENERLQKNYQVILATLWLCLKLSTGTNIKVYQRKGSKDILDTVTLMVELKSSLEQIAKLT